MTKQIYGKLLTTAVLLGTAVTGAHAQLTTSGSYITSGTDTTGLAVTAAPGNTETLTTFQAAIATAFNNNTGGDITFDNLTAATGNFNNPYSATPGTPINATYGTSASNTITFQGSTTANPADPYSFNNNQATLNPPAGTTSGTVYLGTSGGSTPVVFQFSQNLSDFGIVVLNRDAARTVSMTVTLSDGSTVTPDTNVATSTPTTGPIFFEYAPTPGSGLSISSVSFATNGFTRFDDLGFITAAPEPSQYAAFAIGILGIGMLGLRARKRSVQPQTL